MSTARAIEPVVGERCGDPRATPVTVPATKVRPGVPRADSVVRSRLIDQLTGHPGVPIVTVVAPGGYGKTTLLQQWAEQDTLLSTNLLLRKIGERLYISSNTVKTEAISISRKFGVSSRGEAIERAQALGLLER